MKVKSVSIPKVLAFIIVFLVTNSYAQEHYIFIGKSKQHLIAQKGNPDLARPNGKGQILKYNISTIESQTYKVDNEKVIMAIKTIFARSASKAQDNASIQILYYMSLGFTKQGSESGMTILKKGKRVLTIGWMDQVDGYYSTIVSAL